MSQAKDEMPKAMEYQKAMKYHNVSSLCNNHANSDGFEVIQSSQKVKQIRLRIGIKIN